jgi:hypothetical protein
MREERAFASGGGKTTKSVPTVVDPRFIVIAGGDFWSTHGFCHPFILPTLTRQSGGSEVKEGTRVFSDARKKLNSNETSKTSNTNETPRDNSQRNTV